jgi:hypothetical protein
LQPVARQEIWTKESWGGGGVSKQLIKNSRMPLSGRKGGGGDNTSVAVAAKPCCRTAAPSYPPPSPSVTELNQMPHICHSSSATVTTERDRGARGTTSAEGASQGNDEHVGGGGEGPPAPERQRCPSRREGDIDTASAASPRRRTYVITAPPGERRAQRGGGGARAPQHRRTPSTRGPSTPLCHTS